MTIQELEAVLCTIKDKSKKVKIDNYGKDDVNGFYFISDGNEERLILTSLYVQPRQPYEV